MSDPKHALLDIPLFDRVYRLYHLIHKLTPHIPRPKRYTLWRECEMETLGILRGLIHVSHHRGNERVHALLLMSERVDFLKILFRLSRETQTVQEKEYLLLESLLQEIGKMLGGWIKSVSH